MPGEDGQAAPLDRVHVCKLRWMLSMSGRSGSNAN